MIYKVIKEKTWNKNGVETNFFSYVKADSIEQATMRAAKQYGLDDIKEVHEVSSVCNDWVKSRQRITENSSAIYEEATGLIACEDYGIVAVHDFSVGVIAERVVDGQTIYETQIQCSEFKSDDLDGIIDCLWNEYAKFELCEDRSLS